MQHATGVVQTTMLSFPILFFLCAIVAAFCGYTGVVHQDLDLYRSLFVIFLGGFVVSLLKQVRSMR